MSGIPVYTQSPINAAKPSGVTPQTAAPATQTTAYAPSSNTATTTATPAYTSGYPAAQPGAPAVPAPTAAAQRYAPPQPTPTRKTEDGPAAPQPGAFPTPSNGLKSNLPPPPKAGEIYHPPQITPAPSAAVSQPYPPQMAIPPPTTAYGAQPPTSSTSTTTTPSSAYPVSLAVDHQSAPRRSLEHPPGYVQNPYASDLTAEQRQAQAAAEQSTNYSYSDNLDKPNGTAAFGVDPEAVWNTAKKWAQSASEKIQEAEAEVWKRVNKE